MFTDIVFPNGNEQEFIRIAERLSIPSLCLSYSHKKRDTHKAEIERIRKLQEDTEIKLFFGLAVRKEDTREARKFADLILVKSTPDNRVVLEKKEVDMLFSLESNPRKDSMHYRYSSLNHVLADIASKSRVVIAFPLSMCLAGNSEMRVAIIGRIMQNIRLCRKYKAKMAIASFASEPYGMRNPSDLCSLGLALGMTPGEARAAVGLAAERISENQDIKSGKLIAEGIRFKD